MRHLTITILLCVSGALWGQGPDTGWTEMDTTWVPLERMLGTKYLRFIVSPSSPGDSVVVHWYGAGGPPPTARDSLKVAVDLLKRCGEFIAPQPSAMWAIVPGIPHVQLRLGDLEREKRRLLGEIAQEALRDSLLGEIRRFLSGQGDGWVRAGGTRSP